MLTDYKKEQRAQTNRAFAEKQAALGLRTYRFSLPASAQEDFNQDAERARAEHYQRLVDTLPDTAPELLILAESNRPQPLPTEAVEAALEAGFSTLVSDYQSRLDAAVAAENEALSLQKGGCAAASVRKRAEAYVQACFMKLYKNLILAVLEEKA